MRKIGLVSLCSLLSLALSDSAGAMYKSGQGKSVFEDEEQKQSKYIKKDSKYVQAEIQQNLGDAHFADQGFNDAAKYYIKSYEIVSDNEDLLNLFNQIGFSYDADISLTKNRNVLSSLLKQYYSKNF